MTSEVALMNRTAVVLASDSASTITYSEGERSKQRYFKGANKIFNLTVGRPVGLMINGAGSLQRLPWEVITKAYRASRGSKGFDKLGDYSADFFKFLLSKELFPNDYQEKHLIYGVSETAGNIALPILRDSKVVAEPNKAAKNQAAQPLFEQSKKDIEDADCLCDGCDKLIERTKKDYLARIEAEFKTGNVSKRADGVLDIKELIDVAATAHFKQGRWTQLPESGVVVAGYGDKELFASLEQYSCYGVLFGMVLYRKLEDDCRAISFENPAEIVPIAQDEMVRTFMWGASYQNLIQFNLHLLMGVRELTEALVGAGHVDQSVDMDAFKMEALKDFATRNRAHIEKDATRLRRVIALMPVGELAGLAETLVALESLKERVTSETESVSGPIDVAVITKGDGFIWVKRKHYFDPALNPRFMARKFEEGKG